MKQASVDFEALRAQAEAVITHAYAPYSGFRVAAALLCEDGRVFTGVNVENASYGLTLCAERSAISAAVTAGARRFVAIAIVCSGPTAASPCGACRQVLCELPPAFVVRSYGRDGSLLDSTTDALLPDRFVLEG